jgi:soluble lytic murein transglycosylase-like protein
MPEHLHQPVQRRLAVLLTAVAMCLSVPRASSSPAFDDTARAASPVTRAGGITTVQEHGRMVYVNDESPQPTAAPARPRPTRHSVLVYWSNTEHRWKPVPAPSPAAMRAARTAAADVRGYVTAQPRASDAESAALSNPNYSGLARGYRVSAGEIDAAIEQAAARHSVDPNLVRALVKVESNFNPNAVSNKGAMGLMQLMPRTASGLRVNNPFDPQQNVDAGVRHLKQLLNNFNGDVRLSLAAYNAGEGAVKRNRGVPHYGETQNYVKRITELYWNKNGSAFAPSSSPVQVYRGEDGVLRMTNTE